MQKASVSLMAVTLLMLLALSFVHKMFPSTAELTQLSDQWLLLQGVKGILLTLSAIGTVLCAFHAVRLLLSVSKQKPNSLLSALLFGSIALLFFVFWESFLQAQLQGVWLEIWQNLRVPILRYGIAGIATITGALIAISFLVTGAWQWGKGDSNRAMRAFLGSFLSVLLLLGVLLALTHFTNVKILADPWLQLQFIPEHSWSEYALEYQWRRDDWFVKGVSLVLCTSLLAFYGVVLTRIRESIIAMIGLTLVVFWVLIACAAPLMTIEGITSLADPNANASSRRFKRLPMSWRAREVLYFAVIALCVLGVLWAAIRRSLSGVVVFAVLLALIFGFWDMPMPPETGRDKNIGEGVYHWLGTDHNGRDILSRVIWGTQRVLLWASIATVSAYLVGMFFGVAAGYLGGWWDEIISFIANVMLSFPVMVLYMLILTYMGGQSGINVIIAVTFASGPGIMRIVRGLTLDLKTRDYIAAAQTRGENRFYIMLVELLPNARGPLIVDACLRLGYTIIAIATLGFLGLGLPPPDPDWGTMLKEGSGLIAQIQQSKLLIPAAAVSSLILGFNLLADGLRDISLRD